MERVIRLLRLVFAALVLVGLLALVMDLVQTDRFDGVNFFSYFTVQSNLLGVAAFLLAARGGERPGWLDWLRGASVVYLTVTFVVFALLLEDTDVDTTLAWVDLIVHKVFPVVVFVDWLIDPPRDRITPRDAVLWLVYPLGWVAYSLVRGAVGGWYPYPFLDPANGGYGSVAAYIGAIVVFGVLVIAIVAAFGRVMAARRAGHSVGG